MNDSLSRLDFNSFLFSQIIENNFEISRYWPILSLIKFSAAHYTAFVDETKRMPNQWGYVSIDPKGNEHKHYFVQCGVGLCNAPNFSLYQTIVNLWKIILLNWNSNKQFTTLFFSLCNCTAYKNWFIVDLDI